MLEQILARYPRDATSLVMILQDVQAEEGYLSPESLDAVSAALGLPRSQVYAVATFYNVLSLEPRAKHLLRVCVGTACHVRGAPLILDAAVRSLGVEDGGTTADREFTLQSVGCVGACAIGPVVEIDGEHHGHMDVTKTAKLLARRLAAADSKERT
jgi:NADH-quinone oxidoreductase subunit E